MNHAERLAEVKRRLDQGFDLIDHARDHRPELVEQWEARWLTLLAEYDQLCADILEDSREHHDE